jgi:hypothetical protein
MNGTESKAKGEEKGEWRVVRQDSNGARVVEADSLTEEAARAFAERRERQIGHHKQTVWHERMPPKAPAHG